jgi:hypothetical protein
VAHGKPSSGPRQTTRHFAHLHQDYLYIHSRRTPGSRNRVLGGRDPESGGSTYSKIWTGSTRAGVDAVHAAGATTYPHRTSLRAGRISNATTRNPPDSACVIAVFIQTPGHSIRASPSQQLQCDNPQGHGLFPVDFATPCSSWKAGSGPTHSPTTCRLSRIQYPCPKLPIHANRSAQVWPKVVSRGLLRFKVLVGYDMMHEVCARSLGSNIDAKIHYRDDRVGDSGEAVIGRDCLTASPCRPAQKGHVREE